MDKRRSPSQLRVEFLNHIARAVITAFFGAYGTVVTEHLFVSRNEELGMWLGAACFALVAWFYVGKSLVAARRSWRDLQAWGTQDYPSAF